MFPDLTSSLSICHGPCYQYNLPKHLLFYSSQILLLKSKSLLMIFIACISRKCQGFSWRWHSEDDPLSHVHFFYSHNLFLDFSCLGNSNPFSTTYSPWPAPNNLLHLPKVVDVSLLWVPHLLPLLLPWTFQNASHSGEPLFIFGSSY